MPRIITAIAFCVFGFSVLFPQPIYSAMPIASSTTVTCACPFCSALTLTFSEQMNSSDIAIVAKLIEVPPPVVDPNADFPKAKFEIVGILKGEKLVKVGMAFKTQLVGNFPLGQKFLVMGTDPPNVGWTTPMKASDRVFKYLNDVQKLPEKGPERLAFFQDYFEDKESVLAFDAYDEFARAPYEDMIAMKDSMDHEQLISWINNPDTSVNRRRLYFTMLGICGTPKDTELLESLITSDSRKKRAGLDALIACYLMLKGESGVDLVEKTFLIDKEADYVDTLAAVSALRFHGTEVDLVPKQRIVEAIRHLLDRPKMADMIIPDLARWKDWTVMDRLVQMFKDANTDNNWLRVPVITYLRACPKPEAKKYIEELRKIDPESVKRADFFLGFDTEDDWDTDDSDDPQPKDESDKSDKSTEEPGKSESISESIKTPGGIVNVSYTIPQRRQENVKTDFTQSEFTGTDSTQPNLDDQLAPQPPLSTLQNGTFATENDAAEGEVLGNSNAISQTTTSNRRTETIPVPVNPDRTVFVSSTIAPVSPAPEPTAQSNPTAQPVPISAPLVAATTAPNLTWLIILIPMAISGLIFLLLWSVVNGWFERLIF